MNSTDYFVSRKTRNEPELLDEAMRPSDIVEVLRRLKFVEDRYCRIEIDAAVRDYLCRAVTALRRK